MRNECEDFAWTQHKTGPLSAQLSPPPGVISNSSGIFKTTSASQRKQNTFGHACDGAQA